MSQRRLPAEWESQGALQLTWPHEGMDFDDLLAAERCLIELAIVVSREQRLIIVTPNQPLSLPLILAIQGQGGDAGNISCFAAPADDIWARDHGGISVENGNRWKLLDFKFDGWGKKYPASKDNEITRRLFEKRVLGAANRESIDFVLEGGALESDGQGTIMTTRSYWQARHPELTETEINKQLGNWFGAERVIYLEAGHLEGDDTDGHVDTLARFAAANCIVYQRCDDPDDPQYESLQTMALQLRSLRQENDFPYDLIPLPMPQPIHDDMGKRLPAGYANFVIVNNLVVMPVFDDPADDVAEERLREAFPNRRIHRLNARALIGQNGSLHCACMHFPAGAFNSVVTSIHRAA